MRFSRSEVVVRHVILLIAAAIVVIPLFGIFSVAIQPESASVSGFSIPTQFTLDNFARAWDLGNFSNLMRSSAVIGLVVVPVALGASVLSGYAFATMQFRGRGILLICLLIGMVMPFEATVVPLYFMLAPLGLLDTYWAVILPEIGLSIAFGTIWLRSAFGALPRELLEAARIDGANSWQLLREIVVPVSRPAIFTLGILFFMWSWNEFLLALVFLQSFDHLTAPAGLSAFQNQYGTDIPGLSAAALIVMAPVLIVFVLTQRTFVRGFLDGAVKG